MISLFRCEICEARYNSSNCYHDEFFGKVCLCCGSADHSFLDVRYEGKNELISLICSCPLANHSIVQGKRLSINNRRHWIDPDRVAKECGYQETEINHTIGRILTKGCGRHMGTDDVTKMRELAYRSCETERHMCHFTRDVTHLSPSDSEELGESDEDMMSIDSDTTNNL
jgi:hypothetical protein